MNALKNVLAWILIIQLSGLPALLAQPVLIQPNDPFGAQRSVSSGVENLRVSQLSPDGTEAQLTMDYSYDGFGGPIAQVLPVIGKRGEKGISSWFGADPVTVGRGRGTITLKVRYFNDEAGVPPTFTSDQVRILILNQSGTVIVTAVPFLKTIKWGSPDARPAENLAVPKLASIDRTQAEKLAKEKKEAEAKAKLEAEAREKSRLKAEAEAKTRREAEEKAKAEALRLEEARQKAAAEAERLAQQKREAEKALLAEQKAREEEQKRAAAAEAKRLEEERKLAEAKRNEEAKKLAEERKRAAEAEAQRLENERKLAEAKRTADEKAREEARIKAETEAKRLAEEKRVADEKALAESKARKAAEEKAWQEALEQAKAELELKKRAEEKQQAEALVQAPKPVETQQTIPSLEIAADKKTKITNVDVVNRSIDRTQMTFGVEFEYKDQIKDPMLGIDVLRQDEPAVSRYFASELSPIGKSRRNFALFPVKFQPAASPVTADGFATDKVMVYVAEKAAGHRYNLFSATMLLNWRAPGAARTAPSNNGNLVQIEDFKQTDPSSGYVSVRYNLLAGNGSIRAKIYDAARPESATYFTSKNSTVKAGQGVQSIDITVDPDVKISGSELLRADTIEVELLDASGKSVARISKQAAMVWAKPN